MAKIDFHAHILPCCDHGSNSLETSLKQLDLARKADVDIVCATSHYYGHKESANEFLKRRKESGAKLKSALLKTHPLILEGAEVLAFEGIEKLKDLQSLCLEGTDLLLLELPFSNLNSRLLRSVEQLCLSSEIQIVLAHVDRYDFSLLYPLCQSGALCQLNAESLTGFYIKPHIKRMIDEDLVVALGSDIHLTATGYVPWLRAQRRHRKVFEKITDKTNSIIENHRL